MSKFVTGNIDYFFEDLPVYIQNIDGTKTFRLAEGTALIEYSASTYEADDTGETWEPDYTILSLSDVTFTDHEYEPVAEHPDHYGDLIVSSLEKYSGFDIECRVVEAAED